MSELKDKLDEKIPTEAIEHREQAGRQLSYLSGAYVIDRLNQVLGHMNWGYSISDLKCVYEGMVEQRSGPVHSASYIVKVKLQTNALRKEDGFTYETSYEDVGYGDGFDKTNPGKAHELAVKEAVTDGIKRAAKNLGRSMGLELYLKTPTPVGPMKTIRPSEALKAITTDREDPGEYIIKFGKKYNGKKIKEIPSSELTGYVKYLESGLSKDNKPATGMIASFLTNAKQALENAQTRKE